MRINLLICCAVIFMHMLSTADAVQYYVTNSGDGASSNGVADAGDTLISGLGGSAAIGYFDSDGDVTGASSVSELLAAFTVAADSEANFNSAAPLNGTFTVESNVTDSSFEGKSIYLVIGNSSSLDISTDLFVYRFAETFDNTSIDPITLNLDVEQLNDDQILIGSIGEVKSILANGGTSQKTLKLESPPGYKAVPILGSLSINNGAASTESRTVTLNHTLGGEAPTHYRTSENEDFSGADWQDYVDNPTFELSQAPGEKMVYFQLKNENGESLFKSDAIEFEWVNLVDLPGELAASPSTFSLSFIAATAGKYAGFLSSPEDGGLSGYFESIKLGDLGFFSAKMYFGKTLYVIKGEFDGAGGFQKTVAAEQDGEANPAIVDLKLVYTDGGGFKIVGTVEVGEQSAEVSALKNGDATHLKGRYTLLIPALESEPDEPQGHGYGKMKVSINGIAKISGHLGDGKAWKTKCRVTPDGEMLLYKRLYNKQKGWLGGTIRFRDVEGVSDFDGEVQWRKPGKAGFKLQRTLIGSRYQEREVIAGESETKSNVIAAVGPNADFDAGAWEFAWSRFENGKAIYTGPSAETLHMVKKNGQIRGFIPEGGIDFKVKAVVFQKQDMAAGMVQATGGEARSLIILSVD